MVKNVINEHCPDCAEPNEKPVGESIGDAVTKAAEQAARVAEEHGFAPDLDDDDRELEAMKAAELERQERLRRAVEVMGVPHRHAMRLMSGEVQASYALEVYDKWRGVAHPGSILVLSGELGSGKTLAAAKAVMDGPPRSFYGRPWPSDRHPRFIDIGELQAMGLYDKTGAFNALCECSVLAVDDLGREYIDEPGVMRSLIDGLIDRRYRGCGWTVITTNLARSPGKGIARGASFVERYGARVVHRLQEPGCGFVHVQGDFRTRRDA